MSYKNRDTCPTCRIINGRLLKKIILFGCCICFIAFIANIDQSVSRDVDNEIIPENASFWNGEDAVTWMAEMSARMAERRTQLKEKCSLYGLNKEGNDSLHRPNVWEFLINRPYHLVWCNVFKAASTSWMYNFNILAGYKPKFLQSTKEVPLQLARRKYPRPTLDMLKTALNDSVAFLIVRHPLERLLSGYRDKIEYSLPHTYHQKLGISIIGKYRKGATIVKNKLKGRRASNPPYPIFSEFVQYLVDTYNKKEPFDMHWAPINTFCTPCQVDFNIIIKFDTLQDDQNYLIHLGKLEKLIKPQWKNPSKGRSTTADLTHKYYSQLSKSQVLQLYEIYKFDFELFGYTLKGYIDHAYEEPTTTENSTP